MEFLILDGSHVNVLIAFIAGVMTFFASCLLPLVPTYLAYLSGVSLADSSSIQKKWQIFRSALFFVFGFVITFMILGLAANKFAATLAPYRLLLEKFAGVLFIVLGLFILGIFHSNKLSQTRQFDTRKLLTRHRNLHATLTGIAFSIGWTPCIGPVLAVILFWAARAQTALMGTGLLLAFGLGLGIPFLVIAVGFEKIIPIIKKTPHISRITNIISGLLVVLAGVLLLTNQFQNVSMYLLRALDLSPLSI